MANSARTQIALSNGNHFLTRVEAALSKVSYVILNESTGVANHTQRVAFARTVSGNLGQYAVQIAPVLVMRSGIFAFNTSYDFELGDVITAAGDADIETQLTTDWNNLAGV